MLRRLELQGFKTFASRTVFELEPGITAIVGPNGSGKSNLADAVRWVLGEQSLRALRGRRTEDVIFAGAGRRPPFGMAEVVVTLDNSSGRLPLPFAEVSVARRAYRSGENEYLLNGERVRLRDVSDLLLRVGLCANGHVVVGQGLVDTALSLRPEERRALFEDAAAISRHRERLADSRERLALTEQNLVRVSDLAAEIAARLPALARQAERARQALALRAELEDSLVRWYSHLWREAQARMAAFGVESGEALAAVAEAERALAELEARASELAASRDALRVELDDGRRRMAELGKEREALARQLAADVERQRGLAARLAEIAGDVSELEVTRDAEMAALASEREAIAEAEQRLASAVEQLAAEDSGAAERVGKRRDLESRLAAAQGRAEAAGLALAEYRARLHALSDRHTEIEVRLADLRRGQAEVAQAVDRLGARRRQLEDELGRLSDERRTLAAARARAEDVLASVRARQGRLISEVGDLERQIKQLEGRSELLMGWRESQSGYYSGVRAVMRAARHASGAGGGRQLAGVVGPVGELIKVPPHLETAIEVALGGHLQDIVVERWEDAEEAVDLLKRTGAGRATFLPLDTIRASPSGTMPGEGSGVLGVASELVECEARLATVVESLLGHTLVVDDLTVARGILRRAPGGWQIVTLGGEIVRSSGAITGGSGAGSGRGILARERELRRLPEEIASLAARLVEGRKTLQAAQAEEQRAAAALEGVRRRDQEIAAAQRAQESTLGALRREEAAQIQARRWREGEERRLADELARLDREAADTGAALARASADSTAASAEVKLLRAGLSAAEEDERRFLLRSAELRAARASAEQELRDLRWSESRREQSLARIRQQVLERADRLQSLRQAEAELSSRTRAREARCSAIDAELRALAQEAETRERRVAELEAQLRALEPARLKAQECLQASRSRERAASLALERQRAEVGGLLRQVELDLGPVEEEAGVLLVQTGGSVIRLDQATVDARDLPNRIQELRRRLRAAGGVSLEAIGEHDEALARYDFLIGQVRDLEQAAAMLREAIGELEDTMRRRFLATFAAVGDAFQRCFVRLFGGGSARLVLTNPADPETTGVDVVPQLPGRRPQSLAQLSGGERALTAVALIFALLEVNPTPFCVFDEVDAALDEANIGRFCDLLREASAYTQFLLITHSRQTMEAAQALYGLAMEDRAVSRVLSLRLVGAT